MSPDPANAFEAIVRPRSIAAIGASSNPLRLAGRPLRYLVQHGFQGDLFPVNPRYDTLYDLPCYPDVASLPGPCDLALVTLPAHALVEAVSACGEAGIKACIIYAAIPDSERAAVEEGLLAARDRTGIRILGPNGNGVFNVRDRVAMTLSSALMERDEYTPGTIALIGQSGGAMSSVFSQGVQHGVRFSHYIATGNELDLTLEDGMAFLLEQDDVEVIGAFVETFRKPERLLEVAERARALGKGLVVLRAGRSARAGQIALSHTGAMTGSTRHQAAFLDALDVVAVRDLRDVWSVASLLRIRDELRTNALAVVTSSGGVAALAADLAEDEGITLADLAPETRESLATRLGVGSISNPLDMTGVIVDDPELATATLETLDADPAVGAVLMTLSTTGSDEALARALVDAAGRLSVPLLIVWLSEPVAGTGFDVFRASGLPTFTSCREAIQAYGQVARFAPEAPPAASEPAAAVAAEGDAVDEDTVKSWLEELGARTPARRVVGSRDEAVAAADAIGYPVVVKLLDTRVAHRAADGLVRLNLTAPEAVGAAVGAIEASATSAGLTGPLQFLIEEFVVSDGVEWIVGLTNDFQFGPVVVFGVGGILTEVVGDVALAPAPLSGEAATELMLRCRSYGRLRRSIAPAQHDAMRELLVAVAEFGDRRREDLAELDLNPVVLTARDEAVVLDGLARVRRSAHAADTWRAEPAQVSR